MSVEHPIFTTPHRVTLMMREVATPKNYANYHDGDGLPDTLEAWRVHGELPDKNVGLVSDGFGFTDSPDSEWISGGVNSKNVGALALGRQANWFLWGFCAAPHEMTDGARLVFVNTVLYMRQFDGQRALVTKQGRSREWARSYPRFANGQRKSLERSFAPALLAEFDRDPQGFGAFVEKHLPYLVLADKQFTIDETARAWGIPNSSVALLDRAVAELDGAHAERARAVLERYAPEEMRRAADPKAWLAAHTGRLFFSDAGGFRFFVAPAAKTASAGSPRLEVAGTEPDDVVGVDAALDGDTLVIRVTVAPGWHVYPPGSKDGEPMRLEVAKGAFEAAGPLQAPLRSKLTGTFEVRQPLRRVGDGALRAEFVYAACDPMMCLPPRTLEIR